MAKHVQAPPKPPSVYRPGLNLELEQVILKSLSKRPEDRYQSGHEFDHEMSEVADRMCPGWQRSLEPGADLSKMIPMATPAIPIPSPALGNTATAGSSRVAYNPAPPVKPVATKTLGCLSVIALLAIAASVGALAASLIR